MMREVAQQCGGGEQPMPNVWLGATVVTQAEADRDVPKLLSVPARVRFLSIEPMLGPVDLGRFIGACERPEDDPQPIEHCERCGCVWNRDEPHECPPGFGPRPDWVICGGESGPHARPMHPDWARSLKQQCQAAGVPFFMKQMTKKAAIPDDLMVREFPHAA
jgi:protein gp37